MSNKNKQERDPAKDAPESEDAKAKSKSSITPEGKYSPGYETENTQTANVTGQKKEGQAQKETEKEEEKEQEEQEEEKSTGTPSVKTATQTTASAVTPTGGSTRSYQEPTKTTAETPSPLETSRQRAQEREREEQFERYEAHPELRYGRQQGYYDYEQEQRRRAEDSYYRDRQQRQQQQREPERHYQPQDMQQRRAQQYGRPFESEYERERQRQQYVPEHQQRFMQPQQRTFSQRQYQPEDYMQQQNYPQAYAQRYQEPQQRNPQAFTQRYEPQQQRYAQQQPYRGPQGTGYERPHENYEDFENEQNYGNYRGYDRPYGRRFRSAQAPMSEPERERYFEERYRRQNSAYRYGNDVNFGFAPTENQYDTPLPRGQYNQDYNRSRSEETFSRGSGDWSNQGQGYNEYDRGRYWDDDQDWGRRTESHRSDRESDRSYSPGRISRQYLGDDYVPRYSSDWSRGFEDVYERGMREEPWYDQRRDNDNRDTWQDTDRFAARNARRSRYSEDEENRSPGYYDESTPRFDEDYELSSSSGRNVSGQESRRRSSRRNEREPRSEANRAKNRRNR